MCSNSAFGAQKNNLFFVPKNNENGFTIKKLRSILYYENNKKLISLILALAFTFLMCQTLAYAEEAADYGGIDISLYTKSELDLSQYTLDDIRAMSSEEYLNLVKEFEHVYDPYGSYVAEDLSLMNSADLTDENATVSTQWKSGKNNSEGEYTKNGSHEYISAIACTVLNNGKGFFSTDTTANIIIALCISLASMLPDTDEREPAFVGHFYDPDTQKNYVGSAANTARTNAEKHFKAALLSASNGAMDEVYEHLGRCLHYVQDVNVPHHAANVTGVNPSHSAFEKYAFENQEAYLENFGTIPASNYRNAYSWNIGTITHKAAAEAKPMISHVNNILDKSEWSEYARITMQNATRYSAMAIYRFAMESSLTLY